MQEEDGDSESLMSDDDPSLVGCRWSFRLFVVSCPGGCVVVLLVLFL